MVFGGLTLWMQDDHFIKIKPTIVNGLFAGILFGGLLSGRSFLKIVFGEVFHLNGRRLAQADVALGLVLCVPCLLNEVVWRIFQQIRG